MVPENRKNHHIKLHLPKIAWRAQGEKRQEDTRETSAEMGKGM